MIKIAKVNIKGVIVGSDEGWIYEWFGIEHTTPSMVSKAIEKANGGELEIDINSPGGSVYAGSEIYTYIKAYVGKSVARIVGVAASAASVAACGADETIISPTAQIMIHNVSSMARGDYRNLQHEADVIKNYNDSIANAYVLKTGKTREELLTMMDDETWFTAQQAVEHGFADKVMFDDEQAPKLVASLGQTMMLPQAVIDKMRNERGSFKPTSISASNQFDVTQIANQIAEQVKNSLNPHEHPQTNNAPPQETLPNQARKSLSFYQKKLNLSGRVL